MRPRACVCVCESQQMLCDSSGNARCQLESRSKSVNFRADSDSWWQVYTGTLIHAHTDVIHVNAYQGPTQTHAPSVLFISPSVLSVDLSDVCFDFSVCCSVCSLCSGGRGALQIGKFKPRINLKSERGGSRAAGATRCHFLHPKIHFACRFSIFGLKDNS